jgi:hypothetical protein
VSTDLRRQRRLTGRFARVDGIPFTMPVNSEHSPALMVGFGIDAAAAAALLPGGEVHPLRLPNGRGVLFLTVIDYRTTDIGSYIEFSVAIACTHGAEPAPALLPMLLRGHYGTGQYVLDLPVSTEISVRGGKGIWGMPKHQANLDYRISDREVTSQYDLDGQLAVRIEIDVPRSPGIPLSVSSSNYCAFRGMLMRSSIAFQAKAHVAVGRWAGARLYLGDSPRVDPLRTLDISGRPLFTVWLPETHGILDDHIESWFVTSDTPLAPVEEGIDSVVDLTMSEQWLEPPTAPHGSAVGAADS